MATNPFYYDGAIVN